MVWCSCQNSVAAVKLFQQDDERQLMLEGEFAQGQDMAAPGTQFFRVAVRGPDEERDAAHGTHLPILC